MTTASSLEKQSCREFSVKEIKLATKNLSTEYKIGSGGFATVYKGAIDGGKRMVAVKWMNKAVQLGFDEEIASLTKIHHTNIVSLIGFCNKKGKKFLVYEFVANQTLDYHLHRRLKDGHSQLSWNERLNILTGVARGLYHLHYGIHGGSFIHRDVKSTNILLDENYLPKVADFGLAKHVSLDDPRSHISTAAVGTDGYLDPCYRYHRKLTRASDTFSFGVTILEVLSGRRAFDNNRPNEEVVLFAWASDKEAHEILDPTLHRVLSKSSLKESLDICCDVAKRCLDFIPNRRPDMAEVLACLELALFTSNENSGNGENANMPQSIANDSGNGENANMLQSIANDSGNGENANMPQSFANGNGENANMSESFANDSGNGENANMSESIARLAIPLSELEPVTRKYMNELLGAGSRGSKVYYAHYGNRKGTRQGASHVVVKRYKCRLSEQAFRAQVLTLSKLIHENVAKLEGYCVTDDMDYYVYELASRKSLYDILHGEPKDEELPSYLEIISGLSWAKRIKIAVDVAKGLCYIHDDEDLIHRNIKSSNVLIFQGGTAKISDLHISNPCICNFPPPIRGGRRPCELYHPREFSDEGDSKAGDVYSFGIVLLELLTGKKPIDSKVPGMNLVSWATPQLTSEEGLQNILDDRLRNDYPLLSVKKMAAVAVSCLANRPVRRPEISHVLIELQEALRETGN